MTIRRVVLVGFVVSALCGLSRLSAALVVAGLLACIGALVAYGMFRRRGDRVTATVRGTASPLLDLAAVVFAVGAVLAAGGGDARQSLKSGSALAVVAGTCILAGALIAALEQRTPDRALGHLFEAALSLAVLGLFPWAIAVNGDVSVGATVQYLPVLLSAIVLWLSVCLVRSSPGQRGGSVYLVVAAAMLTAADAVAAATPDSGAWHDDLVVVRLLACCLLSVAALEPLVRLPVEPTASLPSRLGPGAVAAPLGLTLLAPALFSLQALSGNPPRLAVVLGGASAVAFLVSVYLVRKVQEGTKNEYRAHHDPLTGLPHRAMFHDRLEVALAAAARTHGHVGVMFLDLDRFKMINDSLGHAVGNQLLQRVAERLRLSLRESDTVARMGGDEFMVLLPTIDGESDCATVADKVLHAFEEPFSVGAQELAISTSIGIAIYPDHGWDADALTRSADLAMYRAKASGRNAYAFYTSDMTARARVKHSLGTSLRIALENDDLRLQYQPKISSRTNEIVGLEALARWPHPQLGFVPPDAFIPIAEETGLINALGEWVLDATCSQIQRLRTDQLDVPIAVNVSAREFAQGRVDVRVAAALERHGVPPQLLELEITESIFIQDLDTATKALFSLRDMGVRCSIDDFGTGYSGLTYLSRLPIYALKIDQSFVQGIGCISGDRIVDAIITLARSLDMRVIAEGVETAVQADFLTDHGCDELQGLLFSPPVGRRELKRLLRGVGSSHARGARDLGSSEIDTATLRSDVGFREVATVLQAVCTNQRVGDIGEEEIAPLLASLRAGGPGQTATTTRHASRLRSTRSRRRTTPRAHPRPPAVDAEHRPDHGFVKRHT
jgi:diguanylate cyclase (GGDEF)-like protein